MELAGKNAGYLPVEFDPYLAAAKEALVSLDFPTTKQEYWKYTRTGKIKNKNWKFSEEARVDQLPTPVLELRNKIVFINGRFSKKFSDFSDVSGMRVQLFSASETFGIKALSPYYNFSETPFLALNHAAPQDGVSLYLSKNTAVEPVLNIINLYSGNEIIVQPRTIIELDSGASLKVSEYHMALGSGSVFSNTAAEIRLGVNSRFGMDCVQMGNAESFHHQQIDAVVDRDAHYTQNNLTLSGGWTRNNSNVRIQGENAEVHLNGFYLPSDSEHVDNHTIVDHEAPHCESNELYRGVILDRAVAIFNGKVYVRPHAQKTNAFQSNGNIIGSDMATANSKPELEIYADDVKCSHGSTTGQLDDEAMFYLMTRGLSRQNARNLLVEAFAADVLNNLVNPEIAPLVEDTIHETLNRQA